MYYQDGQSAKGMHQRRLLIAATLDKLTTPTRRAACRTTPTPTSARRWSASST